MFLRGFNLAFSSLLILTSAAGCTFQNPFGGNANQPSTNYGVIKIVDLSGDKKIGAVNFLEQVDYETGETNTTRGLGAVSGSNLVSGGNPDEFFLVGVNSIHRTTNGGQAWRRQYVFEIKSNKGTREERTAERQQQLAQNNSFALSGFVIDPTDSKNVYVSGLIQKVGKIYKSTDSGATFKEIYSEVTPDVNVSNLSVNPNNNQQIFAVLGGRTILRSNDAGATWQKIKTFNNGGSIIQLSFVKEFNNVLYLLQQNAGIATSPDDGATWKPVLMRRTDSKIGEVQPQDAISLEAGNSNKFGTFERLVPVLSRQGEYLLLADKQLWVTRDLTKTWFKVNLPLQGEQNQITAVAYDPLQGADKMYVTIQNKLFTTSNTGQSWSSETLPVSVPVTKILVDPYTNENLYLMLSTARN